MSATPDPDKNLQRAIDRLHQAAVKGAQIVCLPELFQTQYFCQREDAALFDLAEPIPGPATTRLAEAAKLLHIVLIGSLFERRAPGVYHNTAVMIDADGSLRGIYRKMHIPDDPLYYEHAAEKEQWGAAQHDAWRTIQRAHAIANGVYVAVVNRVGFEEGDIRGNKAPGKGLEFWGGSFVADPFGRVITQASHDKEEILIADVDLKTLEDIRRNWPFLRDRRIDSYGPITSRLID